MLGKDSKYGSSQQNWDMCIIKNTDETPTKANQQMTELELRMKSKGLETFRYMSVQEDEIIIIIRIPEELLKKFATRHDWLVETNSTALRDFAYDLSRNLSTPDRQISDVKKIAAGGFDPFDFIYFAYSDDKIYAPIWKTNVDTGTPFGTVNRSKLIRNMLEFPNLLGGCSLDRLQLKEAEFHIFPLHSEDQRQKLNDEWFGSWKATFALELPIGLMKDYFGEHVAFYFAFLANCSRWLLGLGICGAIVEYVVYHEQNTQAKIVGVFALVVAIWAAFFTDFWIRRERTLQLEWGMSEFEVSEDTRVAFRKHARLQPSPVTGELDYVYPARKRVMRQLLSQCVITLCVAAIIALNVYLYATKISLRNSSSSFLADNAANIFNAILSISISTVNYAYTLLAVYLTEHEIHRTDTEHKDSLIFKLFCVQFINSYASLYYVAFAMIHFEGSCDAMGNCIDDLCYLLATILIERLMFTLIFDNLMPRVTAWQRYKAETAGADVEKFTKAEKEYILDVYDTEMEVINRYMDQVIMFGYMVLFVVALPVAPFIGYLSNIFQINQFGKMLLFRKQRNLPSGSQDIGTFQMCFETLAHIAVITNSALVTFTMVEVFFPNVNILYVVWTFFGIILGIFKCMEWIRDVIPDTPARVELQLERQEFLRKKIMDPKPDEENDNLAAQEQKDVEKIDGYNPQNSLEADGLLYTSKHHQDVDIKISI